MIYPAQTSLIPVQIALARFLEQGGNIFGNYPYWYLGTTPYRYLAGPILPAVLATLHKIFPALSLFDIFFLLLASCFALGALGVYLLVRELSTSEESKTTSEATQSDPGSEQTYDPGSFPTNTLGVLYRIHLGTPALLAALFYLFGPLVPLLFPFSDGLSLISFSFLPFVLLLYTKFLNQENTGPLLTNPPGLRLAGALTLLLLLNISILPTLLIGMAAVFLAATGWEHAEERLKNSLLLTAYCLLLVTLWYTPGFWLARLGVPSLAGRGLIQVLLDLGKLLPAALAIVAAFVSVKFFKKRDLLRDFCFYWLFIFGFLTLMRFISDPDFWLDWMSYHLELQLGLAVTGGLLVNRVLEGQKYQISKIKNQIAILNIKNFLSLLCLFAIYFLLFAFLTNGFVIRTLQSDITRTVEYRIGERLMEVVSAREHLANSPTSERQFPHLRGEILRHLGGVSLATSEVFPWRGGGIAERVFLSGTTAFWLNAFFDIPQVRGGVDQASVDPNWRKAVWEVREGENVEDAERWLRTLNVSYLVVHTEDSEEYYHDFTYPEKFEDAPGFEKIYDAGGDRIYRVTSY